MSLVWPKLVVGLGNPGEKYARTQHNAGFLVVDRLVARLGPRVVRQVQPDGVLFRAAHGGRLLHLLQPSTYMNCSGEPVGRLVRQLGLAPAEILVVGDCLDLPLGRLRLREGGGSGGHKGVESIVHVLGTSEFPRLRVGIGRPGETTVVEYVLSAWMAAELPLVEEVLDASTDAVLYSYRRGVAAAMNAFNGWEPQPTAKRQSVDDTKETDN